MNWVVPMNTMLVAGLRYPARIMAIITVIMDVRVSIWGTVDDARHMAFIAFVVLGVAWFTECVAERAGLGWTD